MTPALRTLPRVGPLHAPAQEDSPLLGLTHGASSKDAAKFVYAVATDAFFLDVAPSGTVYNVDEGELCCEACADVPVPAV